MSLYNVFIVGTYVGNFFCTRQSMGDFRKLFYLCLHSNGIPYDSTPIITTGRKTHPPAELISHRKYHYDGPPATIDVFSKLHRSLVNDSGCCFNLPNGTSRPKVFLFSDQILGRRFRALGVFRGRVGNSYKKSRIFRPCMLCLGPYSLGGRIDWVGVHSDGITYDPAN